MNKFSNKAKQTGFTLIEIIIALAILGAAISGMLYYQSRAETSQKVNDMITASVSMISNIKNNYGPSGSFAAVTIANLIAGGMAVSPFTAGATTITDPFGNAMLAEGSATQFAVRMGPLSKEVCVSLANGLVANALILNVGNVTAVTSGALTGGGVYKASAAAAPDPAILLGTTGCGITTDANRYIAAVFR